jgi:hypothetical protein
MEDVTEWERNLQGAVTCCRLIYRDRSLTTYVSEGGPLSRDLPPSEFDEDEIAERAAEAEEAALWADFDDSNTVFRFSDTDDVDLKTYAIPDEDIDMA